jgi:hypothetical protein
MDVFGVAIVRGAMYGILFSLPFWALSIMLLIYAR